MSARRPNLCMALLIPLALLAGCSAAAPEIVSVGMRLIVHATDDTGGRDERLSVFA